MWTAWYLLPMAFSVWMAIETVRRGHTTPWLWIVLIFGPIGALVYFFVEYVGAAMPTRTFERTKVTSADIRQAELDAKRSDRSDAWARHAFFLRLKGDFRSAHAAAARAFEKDPDNLEGRYEMGASLAALKRPAEALPHLRAVTDRDKQHDSGEALFALARSLDALGKPEDAKRALETLASFSQRPKFLLPLSTLQIECGEKEAARATLTRVIDDAEAVPTYLKREFRPWVREARKALRRLS